MRADAHARQDPDPASTCHVAVNSRLLTFPGRAARIRERSFPSVSPRCAPDAEGEATGGPRAANWTPAPGSSGSPVLLEPSSAGIEAGRDSLHMGTGGQGSHQVNDAWTPLPPDGSPALRATPSADPDSSRSLAMPPPKAAASKFAASPSWTGPCRLPALPVSPAAAGGPGVPRPTHRRLASHDAAPVDISVHLAVPCRLRPLSSPVRRSA